MLGKRKEKKAGQRMRQLDGITNSMNRSSSKLQGIVKDGEPGVLQSMGLQSVRHDLATEQQWASLVAQWLKKKKKKSACNAGSCRRHGFDPWVRKIPGGGHDNPLQYSCLENHTAEETGRLLPIVSQRVGHDLRDLAHTHMY